MEGDGAGYSGEDTLRAVPPGSVASRMAGLGEAVWSGTGMGSRLARAGLAPFSLLYGAAVAWRNRGFDHARLSGVLPQMPLPVLSVGNLSVGGTGKTPVSAWFVSRLREKGAVPAVLLRGYGDDEWRVHTVLNPGVIVVANPDRVAGAAAALSAGADCVVLDDGFQHRRASRVSDVVLINADHWGNGATRLLPAGPFREPLSSLGRATAVVITAKTAQPKQIESLRQLVESHVMAEKIAVLRLKPDRLAAVVSGIGSAGRSESDAGNAGSEGRDEAVPPLAAGLRAYTISAIADPAAFEQQLEIAGVSVLGRYRFPDHHQFDRVEVEKIARVAAGGDGFVCTLKDAVKLAPLWPAFVRPLWYLSQTVVVEHGFEVLVRECDRTLAARATTTFTAG